MRSRYLYYEALQNISLKAFAVVSYVFLFVFHRVAILQIRAIEYSTISDKFSLSNMAYAKIIKFLNYFDVKTPNDIRILTVFSLIVLIFATISLCLSFFKIRTVQRVNFFFSCVGCLLNIAFIIYASIICKKINASDISNQVYFYTLSEIYVAPILYIIGTIFVYSYTKVPKYSLIDGKFLEILVKTLNPRFFPKTFMRNDDSDVIIREEMRQSDVNYIKALSNYLKIMKKALTPRSIWYWITKKSRTKSTKEYRNAVRDERRSTRENEKNYDFRPASFKRNIYEKDLKANNTSADETGITPIEPAPLDQEPTMPVPQKPAFGQNQEADESVSYSKDDYAPKNAAETETVRKTEIIEDKESLESFKRSSGLFDNVCDNYSDYAPKNEK